MDIIDSIMLPYSWIKLTNIPLFLCGHTVAWLVKALRCKLEGCRFSSWLCYWNFSLTCSYCSGVYAAGRDEYQEYFPGWSVCRAEPHHLHVPIVLRWELQPPVTLRACPGLYRGCFTVLGLFILNVVECIET